MWHNLTNHPAHRGANEDSSSSSDGDKSKDPKKD